jgi:hypothetical protein
MHVSSQELPEKALWAEGDALIFTVTPSTLHTGTENETSRTTTALT